jgi:glycogen(starch) synthase
MAADPRLVLMTADTLGGVWHYAIELVSALGARGVHVALATMGAPLNAGQRAQARALKQLTVYESAHALEWMPEPWSEIEQAGDWLLQLESELAPDVIHLNQFCFGAVPFRAPVLVVAHSCVLSWWQAVRGTPAPAEWDRYRSAVRNGLAGASIVVAPTAAMLESIVRNYIALEGCVIPNARSPGEYGPGTKQAVVFAAGRFWDSGKNIAALEAVAPRIAWPVRVAGGMTQPGGGICEARNVEWLGELDCAGIATELARASIYCLPARYEPFGLSILEAALAGCALVLGDIRSLREVWGRTALYVPPDDHDALAACLHRLIADPALRQSLGRIARARALTYTPARQANAYIAAYRRITRAADNRHSAERTLATESDACMS